jgi:hypothetical protein
MHCYSDVVVYDGRVIPRKEWNYWYNDPLDNDDDIDLRDEENIEKSINTCAYDKSLLKENRAFKIQKNKMCNMLKRKLKSITYKNKKLSRKRQ